MFRAFKLILLFLPGLLGSRLFGMQAFKNNCKKGAVAATAGLTYNAHIQREEYIK